MSLEISYEDDTCADELDLDYLTRTEEMIGHEFDPEYVEFLTHHNGGIPVKKYFKCGKHKKTAVKFLCLVADYETNDFGEDDVGIIWSQLQERLGEHLVPFARVEPDDFLCFCYEEGKDVPEIVLWKAQDSTEDTPVKEPVSENFRKFITSLTKL